MIKTIASYLLFFGLTFLVVYLLQFWLDNNYPPEVRFSKLNISIFFGLVSFIICSGFLLLATKPSIKPQLGFIYLPTLFIKGILFYAIFHSSVFSLVDITMVERIQLLVPFILFLVLEVYLITKILNDKNS